MIAGCVIWRCMATIISKSPEDTFEFGQRLAGVARRGWVIGLEGDLGAGKTHLVKGLAAGLGISERITSPTFALVNEYRTGRLPLAHLDLYRLDTMEAIWSAGLELYLEPEGLAVIEWMDRWTGAKPRDFTQVRIEVLDGNERRIVHDDIGF